MVPCVRLYDPDCNVPLDADVLTQMRLLVSFTNLLGRYVPPYTMVVLVLRIVHHSQSLVWVDRVLLPCNRGDADKVCQMTSPDGVGILARGFLVSCRMVFLRGADRSSLRSQ